MTVDPLPALASAAEGSRELDALVAEAIGMRGTVELGDPILGNHRFVPRVLPRFTTSVDAALTLVPPGWRLYTVDSSIEGRSRVMLSGPLHEVEHEGLKGVCPRYEVGVGKSLQAAIVLAALRAREAAP